MNPKKGLILRIVFFHRLKSLNSFDSRKNYQSTMNAKNEITIIIYEGKYDFAETFKCFIDTQKGYDCPAYHISSEHILEDIKEHKPDIIFMDIKMPGMDGYETTRKIKDKPAFQHIPILFLSQYTIAQK
mgnify:CR=1 FL=1